MMLFLVAALTSTFNPQQVAVLGANKYQIENLDLSGVPESGLVFISL
jgi:hypothetical protein